MRDSSNWPRVKKLFAEAQERPAAEQEAFLDEACGDDPDIRVGVEALLEASRRADTFLESIDATYAEALMSEEAAPVRREGDRIGPWRIVRELGRGGMGIVYLAERADGEFEQEVALKLIKRGMDSDAILERFRTERQVMATLRHPFIARFYDGGVTQDGIPWFAMEHVEGVPITDYCNANGLSLRERLALFAKVCRGVEHAHKQLVIHRDLKPSNILITENRNPRILDFGLAKILQNPSGDPATTRREQRWMTLEYASPEQVRGGVVGIHSDTYQLGLILYEMLTGQLPYTVQGLSPTAAERVICETQPTKPSTMVREGGGTAEAAYTSGTSAQSERWRKHLKGDIDTILLKALRKDPSRGYTSAEALANDINRYLRGFPILARPDTTGYRLKKFVKRHRWGVAAAAAIILSLLGGLGAALWQARVASLERDQARLESEKSKEVTNFLVGLFEESDPSIAQGDTITARELLDLGASRITDQLGDQPAVQAQLMNVIGTAYRNRGYYEKALALHQHALELSNSRRETDPLALADLHNNIGEVLYYLGRHEEASSHYKQSLTLRRRHLGNRHIDVAQSLHNLALIDRYQDNLTSAEQRSRQAVTIFEHAWDGDHWRIANAKNVLGQTLTARGNLDDARVLFEEAIVMHQRLQGTMRYELALTVARDNLGHVFRLLGRAGVAEETHRQTLVSYRRLLPEHHPFIGRALSRLAEALHAQKRYDEAEATYREALAHLRHAVKDGDPRLTEPMVGLGQLLFDTGHSTQADSLLRRALTLREETLPTEHRDIAEAKRLLGVSLTQQQRFAEAEPLLLEAYTTLQSKQDVAANQSQQLTARHLEELYSVWGKPDEAARYRVLPETARFADD